MQSNASRIKKLMMHNDFVGKNIYTVGRAKLSSSSVVILIHYAVSNYDNLAESITLFIENGGTQLTLTALKLHYNCTKITLNSLEVSSCKGIHKTGLCEKLPST